MNINNNFSKGIFQNVTQGNINNNFNSPINSIENLNFTNFLSHKIDINCNSLLKNKEFYSPKSISNIKEKIETDFKNISISKENKEKIGKQKNIIHIPHILIGKEKRTLVRLHPIPKNYSIYDMLIIIDKYLKTEPGKRIYNAVYLPMTKNIGKNMGYFFINLVSPKYLIQFYEIFNGFCFNKKNCKTPCSVIFSDNQEIDNLNEDPIRGPIIFVDTIKEENNLNINK